MALSSSVQTALESFVDASSFLTRSNDPSPGMRADRQDRWRMRIISFRFVDFPPAPVGEGNLLSSQ